MITVILKDGTKADIHDTHHLIDTLRNLLGHDMADLVESTIENSETRVEATKLQHKLENFYKNNDNWERVADGYSGALTSLYNDLGELKTELETTKRLNRTSLISSVKSLIVDIGNYV